MSSWTYVTGLINVDVFGKNSYEQEYMLKTILSSMPKITGSEGNVIWDICPCKLRYTYEAVLENTFKNTLSNNAQNFTQADNFNITLHGDLRDRNFTETLHETTKFLFRISKYIMVNNLSITVEGYDKRFTFCNAEVFQNELSTKYSSLLHI